MAQTSYGITRPRRPQAQQFLQSPPDDPYANRFAESAPPTEPAFNAASDTTQQPTQPASYGITRPNADSDNLTKAEDAYYGAVNSVPQKMPRWKATLQMLAYGLGRSFQQHGPAKDWQEFAGQIGEGAGSALSGLIKPTLPGQIKKSYEIERTGRTLKQISDVENAKSLRQSRASNSLRADKKFELDTLYKNFLIDKGVKDQKIRQGTLDDRRLRTEFGQKIMRERQDLREDVFNWQQDVEDTRNEDRDRDYKLRTDEFEHRKTMDQKRLDLAQKREQRIASAGTAGLDSDTVDEWQGDADHYFQLGKDAEDQGSTSQASYYYGLSHEIQRDIRKASKKGVRGSGPAKQYKYTYEDVMERSKSLGPAGQAAAVAEARKRGWIPPE